MNHHPPWFSHRHGRPWVLGMLCLCVIYVGWRSWSPQSVSGAPEPVLTPAPELAPAPPEAADGPPPEIFGEWTDEFHGRRHFRFLADGTGVITLELDALGQLLYGPKLELDLVWVWSNGGLDLTMTGGRPEAQSKSAAAMFGSKFRYELVRVAADSLQIRAADDGTEYTLRRPAAEQPDAPIAPAAP